jgi:hypothetical protein
MCLPIPFRRDFMLGAAIVLLACSAGSSASEFRQPISGAVIFENQCASCHGTRGEGVPGKYDEPLYGNRSIESLARRIERTMPEGEPEACVGEDARLVAEYIYGEFYSVEARQKKGLANAPRIGLARLTVPQFRNAIADLLGHFTPAPGGRGKSNKDSSGNSAQEVASGLRAEYFQSKGMSKADSLQLERIDKRIDFDFGEGSPAEDIDADQFAIVWDGAVVPRHTGHHEFRVRTENGARLYLNMDAAERISRLRDDSGAAGQSALIDGWVSSGEKREHTARVYLLGGRSYPLRVEFFKYKEKTASISVEWKPPHGVWSLLDGDHLKTNAASRTFVLDTPFPADDRSQGYERGSSVSRSWQAAVMNAAAATASEVVNRLPLLAGFSEGESSREERVREFTVRFAEAAFRRPLTGEEEHFYRSVLFTNAQNLEAAVRRAVILILMSPGFIYVDLTPEGEPPTLQTTAARLSLALWDSIPDARLLEAAETGQLATPEQIEDQARRMLADPRARAKMREFFSHWLELEERDLAKDKALFPGFNEVVMADLRYSLELFTEEILWSEQSDYRELLLADYLVLNGRLRELYGYVADREERVEQSSSAAPDERPDIFERVMAQGQRAGVLTHPYLLSAFAYPNNTSPIHRGVFLTRNIIGRPLKPPPVAVAFNEEEFPRESSMREKITLLTRDISCMSCHSIINPLGFALENFDAVGRWRTMENNKLIDAKGSFVTDEGTTVELESALDVAKFAVGSEAAHRAFVSQMFHHLTKQSPYAYGQDTLERLRRQFEEDDFNIQNLMVRIAALAAGHGCTSIQTL